MSAMTTEVNQRIARLGKLNLRLAGHITEVQRGKLLDERDEIVHELLTDLAELHEQERELWVRWNEALLARDARVRDLMNAKVSASAVAYAIKSDRTWPYTVAETIAERIAKWPAKRDKRR